MLAAHTQSAQPARGTFLETDEGLTLTRQRCCTPFAPDQQSENLMHAPVVSQAWSRATKGNRTPPSARFQTTRLMSGLRLDPPAAADA